MNQGNISVLKGHAPRNGHRKVTKPDGKAVDGAAKRILGRQEGAANGKPAVPAAMEKTPDESWGLAQLAAFITAVSRRSAVEAWWIGQALLIARALHKEEGDWLRWLKEEVAGLGRSTAYRYMEICESFTLEEVEGKAIDVLYKLLRIKKGGPNAPDKDGSGKAPAAGKEHTDHDPEGDPQPIELPLPPVTAAEIDALAEFIEKVGGLTRAQYVFQSGIEQLRELDDEEG